MVSVADHHAIGKCIGVIGYDAGARMRSTEV